MIDSYKGYKESVPEEKCGAKKTFIKGIAFDFCILVLATGVGLTSVAHYIKAKAYKYTEVTSTVENIETLYEVHIDSVVAEKDREDIYYVTLSNNKMADLHSPGIFTQMAHPTGDCPLFRMYGDDFIHSEKISKCAEKLREIKLALTQSEYESIIGSDKNHLRMNVTILSLETEVYWGRQPRTVLYRFDCFSNGTFSDQEVSEIKEEFLECINEKSPEKKDFGGGYADFVIVKSY